MSTSRFQVVTDIHLVENLSAELNAILGAGEYALIVSRSAQEDALHPTPVQG